MRSLLLMLVLFAVAGCSGSKKATVKQALLNGTWIPVKQEMGGSALPVTAFQNQRLTINDSTYTVVAESVDKGVLAYGDGKMDIDGREGVNAGRHIKAIYQYTNGLLTICYNLRGDSYPEAFETKNRRLFFLSVFRKTL